MQLVDLVIIGAGPAGMSAAIAARENGISDILVIDREPACGGILKQCIHNGFGLHRFGEELTGPEYSYRYEKKLRDMHIHLLLSTTVLSLSPDKVITASGDKCGCFSIKAKAIILAMGCRERSRGALNIPGTRPAGIFSAGTAQKYVNIKGYMPGEKIVILGSGDIGLIMARRMTLEGAKVVCVCELMPYSGGLNRNIVQCLNDFSIPLLLNHTVTEVHGTERLTGVTIAEVDEKRRPKPGTEKYIDCDTLLLSVGLVPENELTRQAGIKIDPVTQGAAVDESRQTSIEGVFSCGNVLHVHDLVDFVSEEAALAGANAAAYIQGTRKEKNAEIPVSVAGGVRYTVPQTITNSDAGVSLFFRVGAIFHDSYITVKTSSGEIIYKKLKQKIAPGEMERVELFAENLKKAAGGITVSIVPKSEMEKAE